MGQKSKNIFKSAVYPLVFTFMLGTADSAFDNYSGLQRDEQTIDSTTNQYGRRKRRKSNESGVKSNQLDSSLIVEVANSLATDSLKYNTNRDSLGIEINSLINDTLQYSRDLSKEKEIIQTYEIKIREIDSTLSKLYNEVLKSTNYERTNPITFSDSEGREIVERFLILEDDLLNSSLFGEDAENPTLMEDLRLGRDLPIVIAKRGIIDNRKSKNEYETSFENSIKIADENEKNLIESRNNLIEKQKQLENLIKSYSGGSPNSLEQVEETEIDTSINGLIKYVEENIGQDSIDSFVNKRFLGPGYWIENLDSNNVNEGYKIRITSENYGSNKNRYNAGELQQTGDIMGILGSLKDIINNDEKKELIFQYLLDNLKNPSDSSKVKKDNLRIDESAVYYDGDSDLFNNSLVSKSNRRKGRVQIFNNDVLGKIDSSYTNLALRIPYIYLIRRYAEDYKDNLVAKILESIKPTLPESLTVPKDTVSKDITSTDIVQTPRATTEISVNINETKPKSDTVDVIIYSLKFNNYLPFEISGGVNSDKIINLGINYPFGKRSMIGFEFGYPVTNKTTSSDSSELEVDGPYSTREVNKRVLEKRNWDATINYIRKINNFRIGAGVGISAENNTGYVFTKVPLYVNGEPFGDPATNYESIDHTLYHGKLQALIGVNYKRFGIDVVGGIRGLHDLVLDNNNSSELIKGVKGMHNEFYEGIRFRLNISPKPKNTLEQFINTRYLYQEIGRRNKK